MKQKDDSMETFLFVQCSLGISRRSRKIILHFRILWDPALKILFMEIWNAWKQFKWIFTEISDFVVEASVFALPFLEATTTLGLVSRVFETIFYKLKLFESLR